MIPGNIKQQIAGKYPYINSPLVPAKALIVAQRDSAEFGYSLALPEIQALKDEVDGLKRNKEVAILLALEFGYKQCEKGENIQAAIANYKNL